VLTIATRPRGTGQSDCRRRDQNRPRRALVSGFGRAPGLHHRLRPVQCPDEYTLSDNHHQPTQGGSAIQHIFLGTGDDIFWSDGNGNPTVPPASQIANPNPKPGTNNQYMLDGRYSNCSDLAAPGVLPVLRYLDSLRMRQAPSALSGITTC
jgi:hypothetical protein